MKHVKGIYGLKILTTILVLTISLVSISAPAKEVYSWTDDHGVVHYSDTPPEGHTALALDIPEYQQASENGSAPAADEQDAAATDDLTATAAAEEEPIPLTAAQARREKMAKDRQERREAQAEIDTMCQKHSQRVEQMEPYRRVFYTNEEGESVRMDDDLRLQLVDESKAYVAENCD